jgi:AcrR family transcriptional regulator
MASRARARAKAKPEPAGLTRERVCKAALALVDEEGLDALSMRRLGARLGVEAMSLYRHVRGKSDLLDALHAAVLGDIDPPSFKRTGWRAILRGVAAGLRGALLRHPNVIPLFATRPVRAPEARAPVEQVRGALEREGFSKGDARRALIVVGVFTLGHTLGEAHGEPAPHLGVLHPPGAAEFAFGLDLLLDGLAARLSRVRRNSRER